MRPPGSRRSSSLDDILAELRTQHATVLDEVRATLSGLGTAAAGTGPGERGGMVRQVREAERALRDLGRQARALDLASREIAKVSAAGRSMLALDREFQNAARKRGGFLSMLAGLGRAAPVAGAAAGAGLFGGGLATLGIGLGLTAATIGAVGSIVGSGLGAARQFAPLRQRLRTLGGPGALEGLGAQLHLGYSSLELADVRQGLLGAVGGRDFDARQRQRIAGLEQAVTAGERGFGIEASTTLGLFGAMRRTGEGFETGAEGGQALRRLIADAFVSGIEKTRLGEYLAGVEGLLQSEQAASGGAVRAQDLSRILGLLGGSAQPGLQGALGAHALAQLSQGIRAPGGGDAGRSVMLLGLQRQTYTRTLAAMEEGATPGNLERLYRHMHRAYGLRGEAGAQVPEEAVLRLSRMTGVPISKLAGGQYKDTGRIGEGSILSMMHRLASGESGGQERAELEARIAEELADPTRNIEKHTLKQAQHTERLLDIGSRWLETEDSIQGLLAEKIYPAIADLGSGVGSLVQGLVGDRASKEQLKQAVDRLAARAAEAEGDLRAARSTYERSGKGDRDRAQLGEATESYNRRIRHLRGRLADLGPEAALPSLGVDTGALGKVAELWREPLTFLGNAGVGALNLAQGIGNFVVNTPAKLWSWDLDDQSLLAPEFIQPMSYRDESLANPGATRLGLGPTTVDDVIAGRIGSARLPTQGLPPLFPDERAASSPGAVSPEEQARRDASTHRPERPSESRRPQRFDFQHRFDLRVFVNDLAVDAPRVTAPTTSVLQGR